MLLDLLFLVPAAAFFLFFHLGKGSLASWDEAIYATVAKEIFRSGHWLGLTLDGNPWADKPPLCIWATAFFYQLFGVNEFSARLFSALCGFGLVLVTYFLGKTLFNRWAGFLGALVLLSSLHFLRVASFGVMDAPLTFFISLSLYFFWMGRKKNSGLLLSGVFLGLAVMTKSFAAFPIIPITWLYLFFSGERKLFTRPLYWTGLVIAAAIALPWNFYELVHQHSVYLSNGVLKNLFHRTAQALDGHQGDVFFYVHVLFNKYRPWVIFAIPSAIFFLVKSFKERKGGILFLTVWMFVIFFVVTLVQTKLAWYIFPLYPALSLCVGWSLAHFLKENNRRLAQVIFLLLLVFQVWHARVWNHDYSPGIQAASAVKALIPEGQEVYLYNYHEAPAVSFYLDRKTRYVDNPVAFQSAAEALPQFFCFIRTKQLKDVWDLLPPLHLSAEGPFQDLTLLTKK